MLPMSDNLSEDPHIWQKMAHHLVQLSQSPIIDSLADTNVLPQQPPPSPAYEQARDMPVLPDSISSVASAPVPVVASKQAFPCPADNCDKVYKLKSTLKWHSNIYHPAQHRCTWPECTYSSPNMGTTLVHIEKIHLQEIPNRDKHGKAAIRAQAQSYIEVIPLDAEAKQRWISESLQLARTRRANSIARRQPKRLGTAKGGPKQCKSERFEN